MSKYVINTEADRTGVAPADERWIAWFGDFDLDTKVGSGADEEAAVTDLLTNYDWVEA